MHQIGLRGATGTKERPYYAIKQPSKGRKKFSIMAQYKVDGKIKSHVVASDLVNKINALYLKGMSKEDALKQIKEVVAHLYKERDINLKVVTHTEVNKRILEQYWESRYSHRKLIDEGSRRAELNGLLSCLGLLSLVSSSKEDLQKCIDKAFKSNPYRQRLMVMCANSLLKTAGRTEQLTKMRPAKNKVKYLDNSEFIQMLAHITDPNTKMLITIAYYTGLRLGEIFAITEDTLRGSARLFVESQLDSELIIRNTKTHRDRMVQVFPEAKEAINRLIGMDKDALYAIRNIKYGLKVKKACIKAGFRANKQLNFRDLRHCYAIRLLQTGKGVPIAYVAQMLGNSVAVCEQHYVGYISTDFVLDKIEEMMSS